MSTTQFAYRSIKNIAITAGSPSYDRIASLAKDGEKVSAKTFTYSKDGRFFAYVIPTAVRILSCVDASPVAEIPVSNVVEIQFSPKGTYIQTWERLIKVDNDTQHMNMNIFKSESGENVASFSQKNQSGWAFQYTNDEMYCARMVTNQVQFFHSADMGKGVTHRLNIEGIANFSISPGQDYSVAVFVAEKKGAPAAIRIYQVPNFNIPVAKKTFFKADKVQIKWNDIGTSVLALVSTDVDRTNQSYYGESSLLLLSVAGDYDYRVELDKEGAVHDVTWCPNGKEFIVVYGFMPSKTQLFDQRAKPIFDLGINPRNFALPSPHGRFICVAGFGNLNGTVDIWDRPTLEKIATIQAANTSSCMWSPDGQYLLTAILSPRLRVDNGIKVWHAPTGTLVYQESIDELYQVGWQPLDITKFSLPKEFLAPTPHSSVLNNGSNGVTPIVNNSPVLKPVGAYRPPGARGMAAPSIFRREDEGGSRHVPKINSKKGENSKHHREVPESGIVGVVEEEMNKELSKTAAKNKKKRENKKKINTTGGDDPSDTNINMKFLGSNGKKKEEPPPTPLTPDIAMHLSQQPNPEAEKKLRSLQKKMKAIEELKMRQARGDELETTQIQKIKNEVSINKEIQEIRKSIGM